LRLFSLIVSCIGLAACLLLLSVPVVRRVRKIIKRRRDRIPYLTEKAPCPNCGNAGADFKFVEGQQGPMLQRICRTCKAPSYLKPVLPNVGETTWWVKPK
jgi:hypothetical protein